MILPPLFLVTFALVILLGAACAVILWALDRPKRKPGPLPTVTWVPRERVSAVPAKWRRDRW